MFRKRLTALALAVLAALPVALPTLSDAQPPRQGKMHGGAQDESGATMDCQQMVKMQEQMQAEQQQMQTELDEMVTRVNAASGKAQQQAMVDLLTKLVEDQDSMQRMMMKMQPMMMQHMMQHMKSGDMSAMSDCPAMESMPAADGMMKSMQGTDGMMKSMPGTSDSGKSETGGGRSGHH